MHPADEHASITARIEDLREDLIDLEIKLLNNHRDRVGQAHHAYVDQCGAIRVSELPSRDMVRKALDQGYVAIDTETTGFRFLKGARPVSIALVAAGYERHWELKPGITREDLSIDNYYGIPHPISEEAAGVNGYSREKIETLPPCLRSTTFRITQEMHAYPFIIGHNVWFDLGMLSAAVHDSCGTHLSVDPDCVIDTQMLYGILYPKEKRDLNSCLARFGMAREGGQHGALEDARLTRKLFELLAVNFLAAPAALEEDFKIPAGFTETPEA